MYIYCLLILSFTQYILAKDKDPKKTRVMLIGIDGLFKRCMNESEHSSFDYMMQEGSYTLSGRTAIETLSASGWSNILCGLDTEDTGVTNNDWWAPWMYGGHSYNVTPVTGVDEPFPCIFSELKKNNKNLVTKATFAWEWFLNIGNLSMPGSLDEDMLCSPLPDMNMPPSIRCDNIMLQNGLKFIREDFDFAFVYFGSVDESGHMFGFCSPEYIDRISNINKYVEILLDELKGNGIYDNTYIIITTDHGAEYMKPWHGEWDDDNLHVPWYIVGPDVKKNYMIKAKFNDIDIPATIMNLFGYKGNPFWRSTPITEFLNGKGNLK
jgi:predicted AlkP superfamily pyrophosphatase or phosphodiesterase